MVVKILHNLDLVAQKMIKIARINYPNKKERKIYKKLSTKTKIRSQNIITRIDRIKTNLPQDFSKSTEKILNHNIAKIPIIEEITTRKMVVFINQEIIGVEDKIIKEVITKETIHIEIDIESMIDQIIIVVTIITRTVHKIDQICQTLIKNKIIEDRIDKVT